MPISRYSVIISAVLTALMSVSAIADRSDKWDDDEDHRGHRGHQDKSMKVQLGPRPFFLVDDMEEGKLKHKLERCANGPFKTSDFSIGHRGAAMQFPEHTMESYVAAARMGAGIVECDVTFTQDKELVCRHSQCDLHTTTDILRREDLAAKCSVPPVVIDGVLTNAGDIKCCTSDITVDDFKSLCGKMDAADTSATTIEAYLDATSSWRTDLYSACGTLMTHAESIELFKNLGVKMTPELKGPSVEMPFDGFTQEDYAQKMIGEYKAAKVKPSKVFAQSFNLNDVLYWLESEPKFGKQAVYLDGRYDDPAFDYTDPDTWYPNMQELAAAGVNIIAPPMWMLVDLDEAGEIVPSIYAVSAKDADLDIITWTLERSGLLKTGGGWYYTGVNEAIDNDGDMYTMLDVLAQDVGILGIFSDWPATVTYYANCMGFE